MLIADIDGYAPYRPVAPAAPPVNRRAVDTRINSLSNAARSSAYFALEGNAWQRQAARLRLESLQAEITALRDELVRERQSASDSWADARLRQVQEAQDMVDIAQAKFRADDARATANNAVGAAQKYDGLSATSLKDTDVQAAREEARREAAALSALATEAEAAFEREAMELLVHDKERAAAEADEAVNALWTTLEDARRAAPGQYTAIELQLDAAMDVQRFARAEADAARAQLDQFDAQREYRAALAAHEIQRRSLPDISILKRVDGQFETVAEVQIPQGYDGTADLLPPSAGVARTGNGYTFTHIDNPYAFGPVQDTTVTSRLVVPRVEGSLDQKQQVTVEKIDGKWYVTNVDGSADRIEVNAATARVWDAYDRQRQATQRIGQFTAEMQQTTEDAALEVDAWIDSAAAIEADLQRATTAVDAGLATARFNALRAVEELVATKRELQAARENDRAGGRSSASERTLGLQQRVKELGHKAREAIETANRVVEGRKSEAAAQTALATTTEALNKQKAVVAATQAEIDALTKAAVVPGSGSTAGDPAPNPALDAAQDRLLAALTVQKHLELEADLHRKTIELRTAERDLPRAKFDAEAAELAAEAALDRWEKSKNTAAPDLRERLSAAAVAADAHATQTSKTVADAQARLQAAVEAKDRAAEALRTFDGDRKVIDDELQMRSAVEEIVARAGKQRAAAEAEHTRAIKMGLDGGEPPPALIEARAAQRLALLAQEANAAVLAWRELEANYLVAESRGAASDAARSRVEDARTHALDKLSDLKEAIARQSVDKVEATLQEKRAAHENWKRENQYLPETSSATWRELQAAQAELDAAQRGQIANTGAVQEQRAFIAANRNLSTYQQFVNNAKVMSLPHMNDWYARNGGMATELQGEPHIRNMVASALGWTPTVHIDLQNAPATAAQLLRTQDAFANLGKDERAPLDAITKTIMAEGGSTPTVRILPIVYATPEDGVRHTALFEIVGRDATRYVDARGWTYCDIDDFRANNGLPPDNCTLVMPKDGRFSIDRDGNVELMVVDARTETGWQTFRRNYHVDAFAGVAGVIGGVGLIIGSGGLLSVPGAMLIGSSAYGIYAAADDLITQGTHGQSLNPFENERAAMSEVSLLSAVLGLGAMGSAARAGRAMAGTPGATAWLMTSHALGGSAFAAGGVGTYMSSRYLIENWDRLTGADQGFGILNVSLGVADLLSPGVQMAVRTRSPVLTDLPNPLPSALKYGAPTMTAASFFDGLSPFDVTGAATLLSSSAGRAQGIHGRYARHVSLKETARALNAAQAGDAEQAVAHIDNMLRRKTFLGLSDVGIARAEQVKGLLQDIAAKAKQLQPQMAQLDGLKTDYWSTRGLRPTPSLADLGPLKAEIARLRGGMDEDQARIANAVDELAVELERAFEALDARYILGKTLHPASMLGKFKDFGALNMLAGVYFAQRNSLGLPAEVVTGDVIMGSTSAMRGIVQLRIDVLAERSTAARDLAKAEQATLVDKLATTRSSLAAERARGADAAVIGRLVAEEAELQAQIADHGGAIETLQRRIDKMKAITPWLYVAGDALGVVQGVLQLAVRVPAYRAFGYADPVTAVMTHLFTWGSAVQGVGNIAWSSSSLMPKKSLGEHSGFIRVMAPWRAFSVAFNVAGSTAVTTAMVIKYFRPSEDSQAAQSTTPPGNRAPTLPLFDPALPVEGRVPVVTMVIAETGGLG